MPTFQELERAFLNAHKAGDKRAAGLLASEIRNYSQAVAPPKEEPKKEEPKKAPESRNVFRVASDTAIAIANSFAGGIEAAADYVSPGNSFSKAIDKFTKTTENLQSDMVKAGRENFQKDLEAAQTGGEEVAAVAKYIAENPLQAAGQAVGSFLGPGLAIKGSVKAAQLLKLTEKAAGRAGLGAGVVTNAMMAGGDAGGSAYKMVMDTPDEILLQNDFIRQQVDKGVSLEKLKEEAATTAARRASFIPSLIGGATGAFGVERFLAGVGGKAASSTLGGAIKTGLSEAAQEALEEGVTEYSGRSAAQTYDPRIDPTKGVAGAAAMGAALGFIPGAGIGALQARNQLAADAAQKDMEAQQALAQAQETAAAIVPDAQAVQAQAEQAAKPPTTLPFGIASPEQIAAAINPEAAADAQLDALTAAPAATPLEAAVAAPAQDKLPNAKVENETPEQALIRYDAELALGVDSNGKKIPTQALTNKANSRQKIVEELGPENVALIRANAAQPSGIVPGGDQSGAPSASSELGQPSGEPSAPVNAGLDGVRGDVAPAIIPAADQQPTLKPDERVQSQITYKDGGTYVGTTLNGVPDGQGVMTFPNGARYEGGIKNGKVEGQGTFTFADGSSYVGEFKAGDISGRGTLTYADGSVETGIFENGELISEEEPSVTQATEAKQAKKEGPKKEPAPPVDEELDEAALQEELDAELAGTPAPKVEKKDYAATERVFKKEQMPFVTAKVDTRAAIPKNIDEAVSHAGAETAFDQFDTALDSLKETYADQINAENKANTDRHNENQRLGIPSIKPEAVTIYDVLGRMTQSEREAAIDKAIDESKLKPERLGNKKARDSFVKSLSEAQQKAVDAKRKEILKAEIKAVSKLGKKSVSDIREARKKATAGTTVATAKVGKAQPVTTRKVEEKKESENIIERETVAALRSGNTDTILRAIKTGYTDPATKLFATRIEATLGQFGMKPTVVVGKVTDNRPAMYDPATETITVDPTAPRDVSLDTAVLHEYAHFITDRAVDNPQSLTPIQKIALDNLNKLHKHVKSKLGKKYDIKTLKEFIAQSFSDSEFVAEMAKIPPATTVVKVPNALREFATRVMQLLGIKADSASSQVLENIQTMITGPVKGMKAKGVSFMAEPKEPKKAGEYKGKSTEEFIAGQKLPERPKSLLASMFSWFTGSYTKRAKEAAVKYQNEQYWIKDLQRQLDRAGLLITGNEELYNALYDAVSLSAGNFRNLQNTYVSGHLNKINEMLVDMIKKTGMTFDEVMVNLAAYGQVMHEPEVRMVKYLKNVPMRSDLNNINWFGKTVSPATARDNIFEDLTSGGFEAKAESLGMTSKDLAKAYRKLLEDIVADKKNLDPGPDNKFVPQHDVNSDKYTVLGGLTPADIKNHMDSFNKNPDQKRMMDAILKEVRELSDVTIMLNKQANYWSPQVDNLVNFYGYKNYVTFKGKPEREEDADLFYGGDQPLGKELQQKEYTREGRFSLPDNPILSMMADASVAAARSGRKDVSKALYNLAKTELIDGKIEKIVPFADRYKLKEDSELYNLMNRQNVFLHYMPNGEVAVISVKDEKLRNSLRKTIKNNSPLLDTLQTITSGMGQMHTRFNIAFAPKNFIRDMLANAFNISVDMSPGAASNYVGAIANYISSNGLIKSGRVAKAFYEGGADPAKNPKIKALLAKDKSGHVKDLVDYLQNGGDIAYVRSFTAKGQFSDLLDKNQRGPQGTVLNTLEGIGKLFDVYQAAFEFTSRAAAFKIRKAEEMGKLMAKGMSRAEAEKAANKPAAAFAKGLANFEEKGLKARELGSWFMFFSASATGAVRVIEPLAPAISSVFGGYKKAADRAWSELPKELKDRGNREEFTKKFIEQATRGKNTVAVIGGVGAAMYFLAYAMAGEDDFGRNRVVTDDMSRWQRDARFFVGSGINDIITIPWGFGMGAFAALGAQLASLGVSDTKFTDVLANAVPIVMDSFLPIPVSRGSIKDNPLEFFLDSVFPAPAKPLIEFAMNHNSLGQEIYNSRRGPNNSVYTGGDNVPLLFKDASAFMFENFGLRFGPNEMYFFASAYVDAAAKAGVAGWNLLRIGAEGDRDSMERVKQDSLLFSGFVGTRSDYDARAWNKIEKDLKARSDMLNELEKANITAYYEHLADNPLDEFLAAQYNKDANGELKKLRSEGNEIRTNTDYDYATKRALLEMNRAEQTLLKQQLVDMYTAMGYEF
jgi:hypothetical protein